MTTNSFPDRPIRLVLGASRGSAADILARALAPAFSERLHQPVSIELHQGENGVAGARLAASSPADGYTLFMTSLHIHAIGPSLDRALPYDVVRDFLPISLVARCPLALAVHPSLAVHSVQELTRLARARPRELSFASSAIGGSPHLAAALYTSMADVELKHVCYDDTRQLYADLADGRISLSFNNIMSMLEPLSTGKLRGIAVTGARRAPVLPHLPTVAESGLPGYEVTNWLGIVAPARTDPQIVAVLNRAIAGTLQAHAVKQNLAACGMETIGSSATEFADHIRSELSKWAPIVNDCIAPHTNHP